MLYLLMASLVGIGQFRQIYPDLNANRVQWEQAIWSNCASDGSLEAYKCNSNEDQWHECYDIPEQGACLKQNIFDFFKNSQDLQVSLTFKDDVDIQSLKIEISGQNQPFKVDSKVATFYHSKGEMTGFKVSLPGNALEGLVVFDTTPPPKNAECSVDEYFFNYQCVPTSCDNTLLRVSDKFLESANYKIEANNDYRLTIEFKAQFLPCLVPKAYITQGLLDFKLKRFLPSSQITYSSSSPTKLEILLYFDEIRNCTAIQAQGKIVYQCFLAISLTWVQETQYLLILVLQYEIDNSTKASKSLTQIIDTEDGENAPPILVVSTTNDVQINPSQSMLTTVQNIDDQDYANAQVNLKTATIQQDKSNYDLSLVSSQQQENQVNYTLKWDPNSQFNSADTFNLTLVSEVKPSTARRRLASGNSKRSAVNFQFQARSVVTLNEIKKSGPESTFSELEFGLVIGLGFVVSMSFAALTAWIWHHFNSKMKVQRQ